MRYGTHSTGFTLAELLIALAIIGVIATFTIPKVLQAQASEKKKAVFRETIATLSEILNEGVKSGTINGNNTTSFFMERVNAIKLCNSDAEAEGCWDAATQGGSGVNGESNQPGFVLANGATVAGIDNTGSNFTGFIVDWNGADGPNLEGDDQLKLCLCIGPGSCAGNIVGGAPGPGAVGPSGGGGPSNQPLFEEIFQ